jgi:hypothetical protein
MPALSSKIDQSGDRSRTGTLSKAGSRTLRWATVEADQHAWPTSNPWHRLCTVADIAQHAPCDVALVVRAGGAPGLGAVLVKHSAAAPVTTLTTTAATNPARRRRGTASALGYCGVQDRRERRDWRPLSAAKVHRAASQDS